MNEKTIYIAKDPVFYHDGIDTDKPMRPQCWDPDTELRATGWYFYDETWSWSYGPYETRDQAKSACNRYANEVLGG